MSMITAQEARQIMRGSLELKYKDVFDRLDEDIKKAASHGSCRTSFTLAAGSEPLRTFFIDKLAENGYEATTGNNHDWMIKWETQAQAAQVTMDDLLVVQDEIDRLVNLIDKLVDFIFLLHPEIAPLGKEA